MTFKIQASLLLLNLHSSYDYIIAGAGCAGLSLAVHLAQEESLRDKKILLIDKYSKKTNDRTWCFWEKSEGLFDSIVYKSWEELQFFSNHLSKSFSIAPYRYKLIRGIDFYDHCFGILAKHSNIQFHQASIEKVFSDERETGIVVNGQTITAQFVFNSLYEKPSAQKKDLWLLQHFKGWVIETEMPVFDPSKATLMDFRTGQEQGATFFYVMPFSPTKALVEYTLFSPGLLEDHEYEMALVTYLADTLVVNDYRIVEKEFGVIPMTNVSFPRQNHSIRNIGTAGGQTKGSSGYTFQFIQKETSAIVKSLLANGHPFSKPVFSPRFHFYDEVLLSVLYHKRIEGAAIFTDFFKKNKPQNVLKFLDNETSFAEDISIISSLPTAPFAKAALWKLLP